MRALGSFVLGALGMLALVACDSDGAKALHGDAGAAAGGATSSGGASGSPSTGGAAGANGDGGSGGDESVCHASNLSAAPLPCLQDWSHAKAKYPATCTVDVGAYQTECAPYDAIHYHSEGMYVWCYYDTGTGNLIAARSTTDGAGSGGTCLFFDVGFTEPDLGSCAPLCDAGAP